MNSQCIPHDPSTYTDVGSVYNVCIHWEQVPKPKRRRVEIEVAEPQSAASAGATWRPAVAAGVTATRVTVGRPPASKAAGRSAGGGAAAAAALKQGARSGSGAAAAAAGARKPPRKPGKQQAAGQTDRRKANSDFKNGLGPLPPVTLMMDDTVAAREVHIRYAGGAASDAGAGLVVHWPQGLHPSRPQLQLMRHAAAALAVSSTALSAGGSGIPRLILNSRLMAFDGLVVVAGGQARTAGVTHGHG